VVDSCYFEEDDVSTSAKPFITSSGLNAGFVLSGCWLTRRKDSVAPKVFKSDNTALFQGVFIGNLCNSREDTPSPHVLGDFGTDDIDCGNADDQPILLGNYVNGNRTAGHRGFGMGGTGQEYRADFGNNRGLRVPKSPTATLNAIPNLGLPGIVWVDS
jgi:hypothetical protein